MAVNKNLIKGNTSDISGSNFWSSTKIDSKNNFFLGYNGAQFDGWQYTNSAYVWCVKR